MFPKFFAAGKHGDIHLAVAKDGTVIGATLAALGPSPMHDAMAFPDMLGRSTGRKVADAQRQKVRVGRVRRRLGQVARRGRGRRHGRVGDAGPRAPRRRRVLYRLGQHEGLL